MELLSFAVAAGLPPGVLNLINGEPAPMSQAMLDHLSLAKIHFTGSQRVARLLMDGASRQLAGQRQALPLPAAP